MPTLVFRGPRYWSETDERVFFAWLQAIPSVMSVRGRVGSLHVELRATPLPEDELREFRALFKRYRLSDRALDAIA
jgi:hypothetical protein